jgi:hypothetical protein
MAHEKPRPKDQNGRRFRITRRVPSPPPPPPVELEVEDDADRGTPEMDRALRHGCSGCLKVSFLFLIIITASILTTCFFIPAQ